MQTSKSSELIVLHVVVNGVEVDVQTSVHAPLVSVVAKALADTGNTGRDPSDWEVRNSSGVLLESMRKVGDLGLADGAQIFVSLRVGAGG